MAHEVILPIQGQSVETCLILGWKKKVGEQVQEGEALVEVETDKASFEIPAPVSGTLLAIYHQQGEDVPVLAALALIGQPGEAVAAATGSASLAGAPAGAMHAAPAAVGTAPAAPQGAAPTGAGPRVAGATPHRAGGRPAISPRARRLAERSGWSSAEAAATLPQGRGSGPGGRILERDVRQALQARGAAKPREAGPPAEHAPASPGYAPLQAGFAPASPGYAAAKSAQPADFPGPFTEIPVKGVRKIIAERMLASLAGSAQYTMHAWANAEILTAYRQRLKASDEVLGLRGISIGDMVNFAAVRTLAGHPEVNAHFSAGRLLQFQRVHLGFAVDTPRGLVVPVIRNADSLSLKRLAAEAARLAQACLDGTVSLEALSGGTFTVSNLGALGIEFFTPVLNPPQVAILGVGGISLRPVPGPKPGEADTAFRLHIALSLTANHQVLDGAPAARFLAELARNIENIGLLLAG
jgi:pyruvate dehydrogenase E2 component (dihydrolipoamide acetyltransferase)